LGVDAVAVGDGVTTLHVELGAKGVDLADGSLPQFDVVQTNKALDVTVDITNISVAVTNDIDELLGVDVLSGFTTPDLYGDLVAALGESGVDHISVSVSGSLPVDVSDGLAAALVEAGMLDVSGSTNLVLDGSGAGDHLATSLKTMADLGVDQVVLADPGVGHPVYVDFGVSDSISETDIMGLINSLDADHNPATPLFTGSGEVALVVSSALGDRLAGIDGALDKLAELGFTELTVLGGDHSSLVGALEGAPIEVKLIGQLDPL
jgi:methylmalonyl-CoA mutase cobalamin-binding subunit